MVDSFPIPFGRYTLVERLAMGGMAELFLATAPGEHGFQKKVVIKRLLPHLAREPVYTAMFIDEAKLTAALVHPKIAQTHELGRNEQDLFIAMEFVDGIDVLALLREHAWQRRRIPVEQAVWICHEVLDALDFAHNLKDERGESLGIVHRDISPSNVLLSRRGDVKLVDFGIARASAPGRHHRTKSGTLKGKYGYMSPEQVTEQPVDARSDLFSVGVVLAEMLCGRRLFAAAAEIDVLLMVRDALLTRLDQFGGHIPPALDLILRKTLRKDPDERWSSAAELRDTLAEWLFEERQRVGPRNIAELVETFHETAWRRRRESMVKAAAAIAAADQSAVVPAVETLTPTTPTSHGDPVHGGGRPRPETAQVAPPVYTLPEPEPGALSDGGRRRRASSQPDMTIEAAEPMLLELGVELLPEIPRAPIAIERSELTGPVATVEDSVDLDLDDLNDPPFELPGRGLDLDLPGLSGLNAAAAVLEPPRSSLREASRPGLPVDTRARGSGSNPVIDPARNPGSSPALKPRTPSSSPGLEPPARGSQSSPGLEPFGRSGPAIALDEDDDDLGLGPAGPRHEHQPSSATAMTAGATVSGPIPVPLSGPTAAAITAAIPTTNPGISGPNPTAIAAATSAPTPAARPAAPRARPPQSESAYPPARGSTPDLVPSAMTDLDPPVPPPSRGGPVPATARGARASQPIMSSAARNRAISTTPPPDPAAPARRPTPRTEPGRQLLSSELDALGDVDAAAQHLQGPVPLDDGSSGGIAVIEDPGPPRTATGELRRREEAARAARTNDPAATTELGPPNARGDFATVPPMTVMFRLAAAGATGLLTAQVGGIRKEIYVRGGIAEYVTSNMASELLGNYLVARAALSPGELAMALAMMPHYGGKLGDTLVGLGLLKPLEVFRYLNHQIREKLIDVCTWTKGAYAWYEGRTNQKNAFPIDLNPFEVLGAGAMAVRDDVISAWLQQQSAARIVRVRNRPTIELERFEIPGLGLMFDKTDGSRTIGELTAEALDPPHQRRLARMLRLLSQCELVRIEG